MDKKEVASRLQEILNRNSDRKVNKLIPEDIRQLNICIAALTIPVVVKPKGTFCQTPDNCQMSYYHQIGDYYCSKCEKTGLA